MDTPHQTHSPSPSPASVQLEEMYKFEAGAIEFGVIFREFTEAAMLKYEGRPGVADILKKIREDGYFDQGVSIYVYEAGTPKDYLRFDCFEREPHYHYHHLHNLREAGVDIEMEKLVIPGHAECITMNGHWHQLPFDAVANGDIRVWALSKLRTRLPEMLRQAGASELAEKVDQKLCAKAIDALEPYVFGELSDQT